ncbi:MAG: XRE family transcriptional regulator [Sphingobacteriia bacterium]|nr:MAG: XRE family transcriptional regulator [Sphingobacteriia bacterium]TAH06761.1 MAG: XRE family transcriptional regulator [Sphingobacteriia bacterium]
MLFFVPSKIIRQLREQHNYTQAYVAKRLGMSQNAYSKIENAYTQLTVKHVKKLSKVLEVSILDLLKDDFEIHPPSLIQKESITKNSLLMNLKKVAEKLETKHPLKHDFYPLLMSLISTLDNTIDQVH